MLDRGEPFGGFAAVKLNDIRLDRRDRVAGEFGLGVDEQQRDLDRGPRALAQRRGGGEVDVALARFVMDEAAVGGGEADGGSDSDGGGAAPEVHLWGDGVAKVAFSGRIGALAVRGRRSGE